MSKSDQIEAVNTSYCLHHTLAEERALTRITYCTLLSITVVWPQLSPGSTKQTLATNKHQTHDQHITHKHCHIFKAYSTYLTNFHCLFGQTCDRPLSVLTSGDNGEALYTKLIAILILSARLQLYSELPFECLIHGLNRCQRSIEINRVFHFFQVFQVL